MQHAQNDDGVRPIDDHKGRSGEHELARAGQPSRPAPVRVLGQPVNPLTHGGRRYLVAPRGDTQWVRNLRVSGEARLTLGRRTETVRVEEVPDDERAPILRAYLTEWAWEVGRFFGGVGADASDDDLVRIAPKHPVFRIVSSRR